MKDRKTLRLLSDRERGHLWVPAPSQWVPDLELPPGLSHLEAGWKDGGGRALPGGPLRVPKPSQELAARLLGAAPPCPLWSHLPLPLAESGVLPRVSVTFLGLSETCHLCGVASWVGVISSLLLCLSLLPSFPPCLQLSVCQSH